MRHAKSDWSIPGQPDFERSLNERGHRDASLMAERLKELNIKPDAIFSSSSLRTRLTAQYICEKIGFNFENIQWKDSLYEVSLDEILQHIRNFDNNYQSVMMFGHNPTYTHLVEYLTNTSINNMPTAGVANIYLKISSWKEITKGVGELKWFIYPKET
jgi:phosphohistidine phosphatase